MRDYHFGNHLSFLRRERGLSQFQLGSLLGISDKAVSKWENGASKPKIEACMKLADIFGIGVDDLLCQWTPEKKEGQRQMETAKKDLWNKAEDRIYELYGEMPPLPILNRFTVERHILEKTDCIFLFDITSHLMKRLSEKNTLYIWRGNYNSSFTAWLMGATNINPLPAHTYCPQCKQVIFYPESMNGWDIEEKTCTCGGRLIRDGHDLFFEAIYNGKSFMSAECIVAENLMEECWECLINTAMKSFALRKKEKRFLSDKGPVKLTRLFLFPGEEQKQYHLLEDIPDLHGKYLDQKSVDVLSMMLIPSANLNPWESIKSIPGLNDLLSLSMINKAARMRLNQSHIKEAIQGQIMRFSDLVSLNAALHGSYYDHTSNAVTCLLQHPDFTDFPLTREDAWNLVKEHMGSTDENGLAAYITNRLSNGGYCKQLTKRDINLFRQLQLPEWFTDYAQHVRYLFPKCHCIGFAYLDLLKAWSSGDQLHA